MASQAMVQILADTNLFDRNLRSELTVILERIERGLPPITVHVRLDDEEARRDLRRLVNTRPDPIRVRVRADTDVPMAKISHLIAKISLIGPALVQASIVGVGAIAGLGSAFVAAGTAAGAFGLAVAPQIKAMNDNSEAAKKLAKAQEDAARKKQLADQLSASGSEFAEKAQKSYNSARLAAIEAETAYERQTKGLPKATADASLSLAKLKTATQDWSDALSSSTMPVFTKGLDLLRSLLPKLTPLVQATAKQLGKMLDRMQEGVDSGGFAKFINAVVHATQKTLPMLARSFGNIIRGLIGMGRAFKPVTDGMTKSFEDSTQSFEEWGESLSKSKKFQDFLNTYRRGSGQLSETLGNLGEIFVNLLIALGPFTGLLLELVKTFTALLAVIPPPVITALAIAFTTLSISIGTYNAVVRITAAVTRAWAIAQGALNGTLAVNPIALVIGAIAGLAFIIYMVATRTKFFQKAWDAAMVGVRKAVEIWNGIGDFLKDKWNWIASRATSAFNATRDAVKRATSATKNAFVSAYNGVVNFFKSSMNTISSLSKTAWNGITSGIKASLNGIRVGVSATLGAVKTAMSVSWGVIRSAASIAWNGIRNVIVNAFKPLWNGVRGSLNNVKNGIRGVKNTVTGFFKGAGRWLYNSGRALIMGFVNGIKSMIGTAIDAVKSVVNSVKNFFPHSPAKEGPFSGKGYTTFSGAALMEGFLEGMQKSAPILRQGMNDILSGLPSMGPEMSLAGVGAAPGVDSVNAARGSFRNGSRPDLRGDVNPNITVMIGNRVVDQYVEEKITKNNATRDRRTSQGVRR